MWWKKTTRLCASGFLATQREATERFEQLLLQTGRFVECGCLKWTVPAPRQSLALGEMVESYVFELYVEQVSTNDDNITTRLRVHKTLTSPLLQRPLLFENSKSHLGHYFKNDCGKTVSVVTKFDLILVLQ